MAQYSDSSIILDEIYPIVAKALEKNKNKFMTNIGQFMTANGDKIYDIGIYNNIYFTQRDTDNLFNSLGIRELEILNWLKKTFFWNVAYRPLAIKEPYVVVLVMAIRYFLKNKMEKEAEITCIYLTLTGKFYASIFSAGFPTAPPSTHREVMDYVINNMLTEKHSLKTEKNIFGALKMLCNTYLNTYKKEFLSNDLSDNDIGKKLIQQLRDREKSFIKNIATLYYEAYENKLYLNYETDNLADGKDFRLTTSDSLKASSSTENTVNYMVTNGISLKICDKAKNEYVKATEIKDIMEAIVSDKNNLDELRRVINILVCDFFRNFPGKDINSIEFISHSLKAKPNTKDKYILEMKNTILKWLNEDSPNYRRRKNRPATATAYFNGILTYIVLTITVANK